jgi:hypothetical protein
MEDLMPAPVFKKLGENKQKAEPYKKSATAGRIWIFVGNLLLTSCVAEQLSQTLTGVASQIHVLRERQLLDNVSVAIDEPDATPSQLVLSTGQASSTVVGMINAVFTNPFDVGHNTKTLSPGINNTWATNWNMSPVSDPTDLTNLRALYGLLYRSDEQIASIIYDRSYLAGTSLAQLREGCGIEIDPNAKTKTIVNPEQALIAYLFALDAYWISTPPPAASDPTEQQSGSQSLQSSSRSTGENKNFNCFESQVGKPPMKIATLNQRIPQNVTPTGPGTLGLGTTIQQFSLFYPAPYMVADQIRNGLSAECRRYQPAFPG